MRRGLRHRFIKNCDRCGQRERSISYNLMRGVVARSHRGIRRAGLAVRIAIGLVLLHVSALAMMKRAVNSIAAGGGISSGKGLSKRWGIRGQQRKERCYRQKLSRNVPQFHEPLS